MFANIATILDSVGIINLGYKERLDGRTQGAIGESNQYAAYIVLFIPGMIAAAVASRGFKRLLWLGGALASCVALAMTASRGGIVGLVLGCVVGAYLYRHLVSYSRIAGWVLGSLVLLVVILSFSQYGGLLTERVFGQTSQHRRHRGLVGPHRDLVQPVRDDGRNSRSRSSPGSAGTCTGRSPFHFSPHNHYFALWFNLGLVGLFSGCYLLFSAIARARRASLVAEPGVAPPAHRLRHRRHRRVRRGVLRRPARSLDLFLDVHRHRDAPGVVRCTRDRRRSRRSRSRRRQRLRAALPRDAYGWASAQGRRST